ncbi:unnamed protein product [Macrosiphum euphorbiae]|uniref:Trimethylguanosine synthase n=1 Tax=Macrosiphum euphorbiae TaxID=13131 RepID=A0AAV0XGH7_9HEMI|nr:unnamed protein product [Macrosiphum euphorbiae]
MNSLDSDTSCKYEVLAEISFHANTSINQYVKLLCSRLLARSYLNKLDTRCIKQTVSNTEDECAIVQEQFTNLSTDESQQHAEWYAYWEKNGENFVNESWIKLYGSCTLDDLPTDPEELYQNHKEQQYNLLYWKFINEIGSTVSETEKSISENSEDDGWSHTKELVDDDRITNFEFLYKYKNFQQVNSQLSKAYQAISIIGYIYNDQNMFDMGFVQYLKKNIIKSTRHLNVYRFPKMSKGSAFDDNLLLSNSDNCVKSKVKRVKLDEESWYSVTPEIISVHIAERCSCHLLIDPFCGGGSNVIQFAKTCELVIAIDIDPKKIERAPPTLKGDVVFLSPPWGGPDRMDLEEYKLSYIMPEKGGIKQMMSLTRQIHQICALHYQ